MLSCGFDTKKNTFRRKIDILLVLVLIFTLFRGLRWEVGTDWEQYLNVFSNADWNNIFSFKRELEDTMEPGYVALNVLVKKIGGGYTTFLLITNFFILYSYFILSIHCRKYPIYAFASILFSVGFFPVRQNLSVAILLFSYKYIDERKFIPFMLIVLMASCFHYYAVLFLLMYLVRDREISLMMAYVSMFCCLVFSSILSNLKWEIHAIFAFAPPSVYEKIGIYLGTDFDARRSVIEVLLILIFYSVSHFFVKSLKDNESLYTSYRTFLNATLIMYCIRFFFQSFGDLGRLSDFYSIVGSVLLVHSIIYFISGYNKRVDKCVRLAPLLFVCFFFAYRFVRIVQYFPNLMFPYQSLYNNLFL